MNRISAVEQNSSLCKPGATHGLNDDGVIVDEGPTDGQFQQGRLPIHRKLRGAVAALDLDILIFHLEKTQRTPGGLWSVTTVVLSL